MNNKRIKVDPKTFKILSQEADSIKSETETETDTLTSDSESATSLTSDNESIKVIKLNGAENQTKQLQPQPQPQPQPQLLPQPQPQPQRQPEPDKNQTKQQQLPEISSKTSLDGYLRSTQVNENLDESSLENLSEESSSIKNSTETDGETESKAKPENNLEPDIIDLSQSKLYDVLYNIFTDKNGIGISENIEKMSKLFDKHNQIMEKILNQLIIMNSNQKQIRVPEVVQTNTKIANNTNTANNDFRQPSQKNDKNDKN
jgi:hypothetical protein